MNRSEWPEEIMLIKDQKHLKWFITIRNTMTPWDSITGINNSHNIRMCHHHSHMIQGCGHPISILLKMVTIFIHNMFQINIPLHLITIHPFNRRQINPICPENLQNLKESKPILNIWMKESSLLTNKSRPLFTINRNLSWQVLR